MMGALAASLFISDKPLARDVRLPDGTVHTLHFRQLPASAFRGFRMAQDKGEPAQSRAMAKLIADSLCDESGAPAIDEKEAAQLNAAAERAISEAILDVNGLGPKEDAELGNALPGAASSGFGTS